MRSEMKNFNLKESQGIEDVHESSTTVLSLGNEASIVSVYRIL